MELSVTAIATTQASLENLMGHDRQALEEYFASIGEKSFRATQVLKWVHQQGIYDFSDMTNLSKSLRTNLASRATFTVPDIIKDQVSDDGTRK